MEKHAPSFGDKFAHLRQAAQAQEKCAWIPSAIHTLIMAALARIFGRLEQLFQLWQAGTLPAPLVRRPPARPRTAAARPFSRPSVCQARRRAPEIRPRATRPTASHPVHGVPKPKGTPAAKHRRTRPQRAPPAKNAFWQRRAAAFLLLRNQNN